LSYMRQGYTKAEAKYGDRFKGHSLFFAVAEACDPYTKRCEYEGQQFKVSWGFRDNGDAFAYCEEYYGEFDEDEEEVE